MAERPTTSLQENLLTILCHDDTQGRLVKGMIEPALFEGDYRTIAERAIEYWDRYDKAPRDHTPDLVADIIDNPRNKKAGTYKRILSAMLHLADGMNTNYVVDQVRKFSRAQKLKDAIHKSAERLNANQELAIEDVENIWSDLLRQKGDAFFEPGIRLTDFKRVIDSMDQRQDEFTTGIREFDSRYLVPVRGTSTLLLGATGRGKSWWLIQYGKQAIKAGKKVLHLSLEMSEESVMQRYYQSLFNIPKRQGEFIIQSIVFDEDGRMTGFKPRKLRPEWALDSPIVHEELANRVIRWEKRLNNLIVKRFAKMSIRDFETYLDMLELEEGFVPDLVLLDYFGLVSVGSGRDFRLNIGNAYKDWRSILIERHMAGITPQQASKEGAIAATVRKHHVAEDFSLVASSDFCYTYSSTDMEQKLGLARLFVDKGREEADGFGVLLTQSYKTGQFVIRSTPLHHGVYFDIIKDIAKREKEDDSFEAE